MNTPAPVPAPAAAAMTPVQILAEGKAIVDLADQLYTRLDKLQAKAPSDALRWARGMVSTVQGQLASHVNDTLAPNVEKTTPPAAPEKTPAN